MSLTIGVLALQGDVSEHVSKLGEIGIDTCEVRTARDLDTVDGIILPGGESTTVGKLLARFEILEPLRKRIADGMPVYGSCTGLILLAKDVDGAMEGQPFLGVMDIHVERNAFGRQRESFEAPLTLSLPGQEDSPFPGVFIRAPLVRSVDQGVQVLARYQDRIVAVQQGSLLATAFHPELTDDTRVHAHFGAMCAQAAKS